MIDGNNLALEGVEFDFLTAANDDAIGNTLTQEEFLQRRCSYVSKVAGGKDDHTFSVDVLTKSGKFVTVILSSIFTLVEKNKGKPVTIDSTKSLTFSKEVAAAFNSVVENGAVVCLEFERKSAYLYRAPVPDVSV